MRISVAKIMILVALGSCVHLAALARDTPEPIWVKEMTGTWAIVDGAKGFVALMHITPEGKGDIHIVATGNKPPLDRYYEIQNVFVGEGGTVTIDAKTRDARILQLTGHAFGTQETGVAYLSGSVEKSIIDLKEAPFYKDAHYLARMAEGIKLVSSKPAKNESQNQLPQFNSRKSRIED
jgi:hypothetical protein